MLTRDDGTEEENTKGRSKKWESHQCAPLPPPHPGLATAFYSYPLSVCAHPRPPYPR
ncbi:hypothetical protein BDN70DRAFT_939121 [Pholiota conissans]|uniref:Uncharacterized protein n=1 Tax=Pholiota conissans TaxID=109636 RepID=A0A9P5YJV7_9AGAR|nr:hypothetical protein BDN70DRAFT_940073 [Pholiota conissans]KAF9471193.1 hypothetical protein BDN70DRAFT_939121 [Pholiota conissans]